MYNCIYKIYVLEKGYITQCTLKLDSVNIWEQTVHPIHFHREIVKVSGTKGNRGGEEGNARGKRREEGDLF